MVLRAQDEVEVEVEVEVDVERACKLVWVTVVLATKLSPKRNTLPKGVTT